MTKRMKNSNSTDNHYDVAMLLKEKYGFEYVCTDIGKEQWYEFKDHRWQSVQKGYTLKLKIHTEIFEDFLEASRYYASKAMTGNCTDIEQRHWAEKAEECLKIATHKLKNEGFASQVMKTSALLFYKRKEDFIEKLDENHFLLGVENGVIDLVEDDPRPNQEHRIILREGYPDDYITKTTRVEYIPYEHFLSTKDPRVKELDIFRESIFCNEDLRDYFEGVFSSALDGYSRWEKLFILIGDGSNGKSKYMTVLENAFGDYTTKVSSSMLTGKRSLSSSATPDIMSMKGTRLVTCQEPDKTEVFNMGIVKELTGGDTLTGRNLFETQQNFKPQALLTIACNCPPKVDNNFDFGTRRRLEYIPFETTFKDSPQKDNERKIDPYLGIKMKNWNEVTLSYLIHRYCRMRKEGLKVPERVQQENMEFERLNNSIQQWTEEYIVEDEDGRIKQKEAYTRFKMWMKENNSQCNIPNQKDFVDYLSKHFDKEPVKRMWEGYSLKDDEEDEGGGEASIY